MRNIVIVVIVVGLLGAGWYFVSPLFIDETVDEALPLVLPDGSLDLDRVMSMPASKRDAMRDEIMDSAAGAPDTAASETMPEATPVLVAEGRFVDADAIHKGRGRALVYSLADGRHVVRFEDFRTTNGPALVVYLAAHPDPRTAADVSDDGFVELGELKGNVGNQNYFVPAGTDVKAYGSVVIWCELFDVLFSPAALNVVESP